ncbi:MAG: amidohydrolase [Deltaproteobacteria bacterium]|nr:amidohydrolase [Deltaproteobacteria bacterium]MBW2306478.1 amidohydrolase [Deltaproteobacteria bacterium]
MIVDFHAHIGQSKIFGNRFANTKSVVEVMDRHKIDRAVLIPTASSVNTRYYEDVKEALEEFPDRFYGFFLANPREENVCDLLDMAINDYGFMGVKLHPTFMAFAADDHDLVYPIVEKARELNICVMIHSGQSPYGTPWQVGLVALDFPDVRVVMAHMGLDEIVLCDAAINMAKRAPNLYLETTGVTAEAKIALAVHEIGASRVLYGSDLPFHNPSVEMSKVKYAEISDEARNLIMGENAERLFESIG